MRATLDNVENRKKSEIVVTLAAMWKAEDASKKEIYKQAYEKDMVSDYGHSRQCIMLSHNNSRVSDTNDYVNYYFSDRA